MTNPMYRQIADELRGQIESGRLASGEQLPTEIELRDRYGASRNTVRDAIKWLTTLGLVETRPGQGTFVVKKIHPFVTTLSANPKTGESKTYQFEVSEQNRQPSSSAPQVEIQEATAELAAQLSIVEGSEVISRHQRRYIDNTPWSLQTTFYPMELVDRGAERLRGASDIPQGTVQYLRETLDVVQVGYRDLITVRAPNATEADFFRLPQDGRVGVLETIRIAFDQVGKPIRLTNTVFPADRNQFLVEIGDVPERHGQAPGPSGNSG